MVDAMLRKPWLVMSSLLIPKAPQRRVDCVFRHGPVSVSRAGENVLAVAGYRVQSAQDGDGLGREGRDVRRAHFHFLGRDAPFGLVQVNLRSLGLA
jgi:hypothetical protein